MRQGKPPPQQSKCVHVQEFPSQQSSSISSHFNYLFFSFSFSPSVILSPPSSKIQLHCKIITATGPHNTDSLCLILPLKMSSPVLSTSNFFLINTSVFYTNISFSCIHSQKYTSHIIGSVPPLCLVSLLPVPFHITLTFNILIIKAMPFKNKRIQIYELPPNERLNNDF